MMIDSGTVYDPNGNVDPRRPLAGQPLPQRTGVSGMYYSEGNYVIMSAVDADNRPHGYVALIRSENEHLELVDHYVTWSDALGAMDWHNARDRREWDIQREAATINT